MRKPGTGQLTYIIKGVFNEPVDGFAAEDYVLVNKADTALIPAIVPSDFTFDALDSVMPVLPHHAHLIQ